MQLHSLEPDIAKSMGEEEPDGFGSVSLAALVALADPDLELRRSSAWDRC